MSARPPFCPVEKQALAAFEELTSPGAHVLLAVSGGSDSLGLMHLASAVADQIGIRLSVGFVDHGMREGIDQELDLVRARAGALGLGVEWARIPREQARRTRRSGSVQAWAREARYRLLGEMADRIGAGNVATGHTLDDQSETVMLRLLRGTGLDGLAAMRPKTEIRGVLLIRPLLSLTREQIREYLADRGVAWVEDPTNQDRRYMRVRVRQELLPLMSEIVPGIHQRLCALAGDTRAAVDFLDREIGAKIPMEPLRLTGGVKVDFEAFTRLPRPLWSRAVRLALHRVKGDLRRIERVHLAAIEEQIAARGTTDALPLPGELTAYVYRGSLYAFGHKLPAGPKDAARPVAVAKGVWKAEHDALGAAVEIRADEPGDLGDLDVRARRAGDRLWGSNRRFKEVLADSKIPRCYRDYVPVLAEGSRVISSPALRGSRRNDIAVRWMFDKCAPILDIDL